MDNFYILLMEEEKMKKLFKTLLLVATTTATIQISAQRACHASDKHCQWRKHHKHEDRGPVAKIVSPVTVPLYPVAEPVEWVAEGTDDLLLWPYRNRN